MAKQTFTSGQVLTAAQVNALQLNDYNQTVSTKTATYVLVAADVGTTIAMNAAGSTTITVNTALFAAGDTLDITNIGAGTTTITAGTATVSTAATLALTQYASGTLYFTSPGVAIWLGSARAVSLTSQSADLGADVTMTAANTFYDGVSITLAAGTWFVVATILIADPSNTGGEVGAKLWDSTTTFSSGALYFPAITGQSSFITLSAVVTPTTSTTYKMSAICTQNIHVIKAATVSNSMGNNAGHISAVKII